MARQLKISTLVPSAPGFSRVGSRQHHVAAQRSLPDEETNSPPSRRQPNSRGNSSPPCVASSPCCGCIVARWLFSRPLRL
jgi:hypothetical protein